MSDQKPSNKLGKLLFEYLEEISSDENSEAYLKGEGVDPDQLVRESIKKIKQAKMMMASNSIQIEFSTLQDKLLVKVRSEVDRILADVGFNLAAFVKRENINVAYRNLDEMSKDEVREFLERHYLLKAQKEADKK